MGGNLTRLRKGLFGRRLCMPHRSRSDPKSLVNKQRTTDSVWFSVKMTYAALTSFSGDLTLATKQTQAKLRRLCCGERWRSLVTNQTRPYRSSSTYNKYTSPTKLCIKYIWIILSVHDKIFMINMVQQITITLAS